MRKNFSYLIPFFLLLIFPVACKKVIKLDLNTSSPQIVIQGNIYDQSGPYNVKIFKTVNFDQSNVYPPVSGALVTITDSSGNVERLTEKMPGVYLASATQGVPGWTYTLNVILDGQTYTSVSTMPFAVEIGTIYFQKSLFGSEIYPVITFNDPVNITNFYRLILFINGIKQQDINVTDDRLSEGKTISYIIRPLDTDVKLKSGDNVTILLETVDKGVYEYFRTAGREEGQSASPANPTSNISNGVLGYFNACSVRMLSAIIP